jgi:DNA (cytosine-5)-methyltransferase 1
MLEFYLKYYPSKFTPKAKKLAEEIKLILAAENIAIAKAPEPEINLLYKSLINSDLYNELNDLYYTIRQNNGDQHSLLCKYLPELKTPPRGDLLFADFFSGAGGLSQGLINAGFKPAFVNDNYIDSLETYYFNHFLALDYFYNSDIQDIAENIETYKYLFKSVKVIAGGPPCQGFSTANRWNFEIEAESKKKRFIEDDRNKLYKYFVRILGSVKPDFFIIENVVGMMRVQSQIEEDIQLATRDRYSFLPLTLHAQKYNIPQSRRRYFLIGCCNFMFIEKIKENIKSAESTPGKYTLKDALSGLPVIGTNPYKLNTEFESEQNGFAIRKILLPKNEFINNINHNLTFNYILNHKSRYNNENDLEIFALLPEGQNSLHESVRHLIKYKSRDHIFKDKYFKLKSDEVSKTMTSHMRFDCHMYIHPEQPRGLSPREAARLQTFPDDYFFRGNLNSWYRQIGNAVPVKLAEIIAMQIIKYYR